MIALPNRLPFILPDFLRTSWVSDHARAVWEPRLTRVRQAWAAIEVASVEREVRPVALVAMRDDQMESRFADLAHRGLAATIVAKTRSIRGYSTSIKPVRPGEQASLRVAVGRRDAVDRLATAYAQGDTTRVGAELGYPRCCCQFFHEAWVEAKLRDTTWPMGAASATTRSDDVASQALRGATLASVDCGGPPGANILWRWLGVRAVPHLPCRLDCVETVIRAGAMMEVGRAVGFDREMDDLATILSWPVEWSALHGIAEIKSPILKMITQTDATRGRYRVRRHGTSYPAEGAAGMVFPFQPPATPLVSLSRRFQDGLAVVGAEQRPRENGFSSRAAMNEAHAPLVGAASALMLGTGGSVLDLGCGDGTLLHKLTMRIPGVVPSGVDIDRAAITAARCALPAFADRFHVGDMFDETPVLTSRHRLVFLALRRLDEVAPARARWLLARLAALAEHVLAYVYAEQRRRISLPERARHWGLELEAPSGEEPLVHWAALRLT
jgi:hypothetical protein